jgi:putative ABC transport system permease protein
MKAVQERLYAANRMRVILSARTFDDIRARAYRKDRGMAILMAIVCAALLLVTAAGIVGLASFWVGQRHRQIGIRRALGATRRNILAYFQTENLLIAGTSVVIGAIGAFGLNQWLVAHFEMARLSPLYVLIGAVTILVLGQLAVLSPALRASRVPPVAATRAA